MSRSTKSKVNSARFRINEKRCSDSMCHRENSFTCTLSLGAIGDAFDSVDRNNLYVSDRTLAIGECHRSIGMERGPIHLDDTMHMSVRKIVRDEFASGQSHNETSFGGA